MKPIKQIIFILCLLIAPFYAQAAQKAYVLTIDSAIGPAVAQYITSGIQEAQQTNAQFVVLQIDTPGGLDKSMRVIIKQMLNAQIPVISYVAPQGARAASAGTFILYASNIAAMSPGTNLGAASPVSMTTPSAGPEEKKEQPKETSTSEEKVKKDAVAYISSLAELRGRNKSFAIAAVQNAKSFSAEQALKMNVINLIASNITELTKKIDGKSVKLSDNTTVKLNTKNLSLIYYQPNWKVKLLTVITDPSFAYIFLLAGIYGLLFEFFNPGAIVPGVIGALAILLALYGLHLLPINYTGLALIILGVIFFVSEIFIPSFGALGIGGTIAFIFGSIMLLEADTAWYGLPWEIIVIMTGVNVIVLSAMVILVLKARKRPKVSGHTYMLGKTGTIIAVNQDQTYWAMVAGERWHCESNSSLSKGDNIKVISINGLNLTVTKKGD